MNPIHGLQQPRLATRVRRILAVTLAGLAIAASYARVRKALRVMREREASDALNVWADDGGPPQPQPASTAD